MYDLPKRLQHVQRFRLAALLALDQSDARMGNGQELDVGVLSRTLLVPGKEDRKFSKIKSGRWELLCSRKLTETG